MSSSQRTGLSAQAHPVSHPQAHSPWMMPALYAAAVIIFSDMYLTQPILPILSKELGTAPATPGLSVSMVVLLIALASTAYGPLSDLWGRKFVLVVSCALLALPT